LPESLAVATRVLLTELGPSSRENISTIVCKVSEWLKCDSSAYACIENSQEEYIDKLRAGIEELSSLLKTKSSFVYQCLTPMEIQLANLIKQGKGNNQIADLMNLSRRTVEVHRYNIRKKLQLDKKRVNLKTYLLTMG